jgi:hypothetical protein
VLQSLTHLTNDSLAIPIMVILIFVIEEVIPMLIVLDWSFMEIFVIHADPISYSAAMRITRGVPAGDPAGSLEI